MSLPTRTRILSAGLTALAIGVVAACSGPATPAGTGTSTGAATSSGSGVDTLVIANAVKVDTLDPEANSVNESIWLDQNLYSRLLQPNATGTALLPDLATSWDISSNGLSYTFHLRPDAQFADGSPVTAADVVYSIERSRKFSGGWGFLLTPVKTITASGTHTVVITLSQPHAPLLAVDYIERAVLALVQDQTAKIIVVAGGQLPVAGQIVGQLRDLLAAPAIGALIFR